MSHQTGIKASGNLRTFLAEAKTNNTRMIKVVITEETLELKHYEQAQCSWEEDFDRLILPQLEDRCPCYILYRTDTETTQGYQWIFISFIPDDSPVRQKMLYSATKATMKTEFGGGQIKEEFHATNKDEAGLQGFLHHKDTQDAPAPLTAAEEELQIIKQNEVNADVGVDTKHQTMQGLAFPIEKDAQQKLEDLRDNSLNYVQLKLDLENERVQLASFENTSVQDLSSRIPTDHARYHFLRFPHTHEGDHRNDIVFLYSMPGYSCSIKERMLYSSCKGPFLDSCEQMGLEISRKVEIDDPKEVTEEFIYNEVHPKVTIVKPKFSKPRGPAGRGPKRMTRQTDS